MDGHPNSFHYLDCVVVLTIDDLRLYSKWWLWSRVRVGVRSSTVFLLWLVYTYTPASCICFFVYPVRIFPCRSGVLQPCGFLIPMSCFLSTYLEESHPSFMRYWQHMGRIWKTSQILFARSDWRMSGLQHPMFSNNVYLSTGRNIRLGGAHPCCPTSSPPLLWRHEGFCDPRQRHKQIVNWTSNTSTPQLSNSPIR